MGPSPVNAEPPGRRPVVSSVAPSRRLLAAVVPSASWLTCLAGGAGVTLVAYVAPGAAPVLCDGEGCQRLTDPSDLCREVASKPRPAARHA